PCIAMTVSFSPCLRRGSRALAVLAAAVLAAPALAQRADPIEGEWYGVADVAPDSGLPVSVRLKVRLRGDSVLAELTLPESRQIALAIPSPYSDSTHASFAGGVLRMEFTPDIGLGFIGRLGIPREAERIRFEGRLAGSDRMAGRIEITTWASPITLRRGAPPVEYREEAVRFTSPETPLTLGGKLVLPRGRGPFPAVVFVTGSDPDTRDAWLYEAAALARRGVASLLYDKRGVGESAGASHDLASWDDLADDADAAVRYLMTRADVIDTARVGMVGQSQGTWIITKAAVRDPAVRFVAFISGNGMSAAEQETYRTGALMAADGFSQAEIERARAFQRQKFQVARTGVGWEALDSAMARLRADSVRWFPGYGTGAAARTLGVLRLYGVLQFNYDPRPDLRRIRVPVLVVMGANDRVFPPDTVVRRMRETLAQAGNRDVTTHIVPGASHGLMAVQTWRGRPFRRAISPEFLQVLTGWIADRTGRR
ncbi:MAG TPA: alpha/beta hydrolase, partial [Longimicrobiaceae bacterium]